MKHWLLIFTILLFIFISCGSPKSKIRFDGIYQTILEVESEDTLSHFIKFYPDQTLIAVSTTGNKNDIKKWFNKEHENICSGIYLITGDSISFVLNCERGIITYNGEISDSCLHLNVKSYINDYTETKRYYFVKEE